MFSVMVTSIVCIFRGCCFAVISGVLYGANFIPVIYIQDNYAGASQDGKGHDHLVSLHDLITLTFIKGCIMRNAPTVKAC